jgi:hypothetical protein
LPPGLPLPVVAVEEPPAGGSTAGQAQRPNAITATSTRQSKRERRVVLVFMVFLLKIFVSPHRRSVHFFLHYIIKMQENQEGRVHFPAHTLPKFTPVFCAFFTKGNTVSCTDWGAERASFLQKIPFSQHTGAVIRRFPQKNSVPKDAVLGYGVIRCRE